MSLPKTLSNHAERSSLLKKSLSDVLVRFSPLAGRIKDKSSIDCNDEGVEFYEANVRNKTRIIGFDNATEFNQEHNTTMKRIKDTENFFTWKPNVGKNHGRRQHTDKFHYE